MRLYPFLLILLLASCGGKVLPPDPMKKIKEDLKGKHAYTILLDDMDLKGKQYYHRYKYFYIDKSNKVDVVKGTLTKVSNDFFAQHYENIGMEIYNKFPNGNINHLASPPGFSLFVGDTTFGQWALLSVDEFGDSSRVWQFSPPYHFLEKELGLNAGQVKKEDYDNFIETGFMTKPYYGKHWHPDSTQFGTNGVYTHILRPWFFMRMLNNNGFLKSNYGNSSGGGFRGGGGFGK